MEDFEVAPLPARGNVCLVAMSGGVDSTYVCNILQSRGCTVIGATMDIMQGGCYNKGGACFSPLHKKDIKDCKNFCAEHKIAHYVIDLKNIYKKKVLDEVVKTYLLGITPNPCVICNKEIKFGAFIDAIEELGIHFDYFCTGHYARVVQKKSIDKDDYTYYIQKSLDAKKDQSYFLSRLDSKTLSRVRFPLSDFYKEDVFNNSRQLGIPAAQKAESQDFATGDYFSSLFNNRGNKSGLIVDCNDKPLGKHHGIENYTIGKRRGLDTPLNYPLYVTKIDANENKIIVGKEDALYKSFCRLKNMHFQSGTPPEFPLKTTAKFRLASPCVPVTITKENDDLYNVTFDTPQKAITPGQTFVTYNSQNIITSSAIIIP